MLELDLKESRQGSDDFDVTMHVDFTKRSRMIRNITHETYMYDLSDTVITPRFPFDITPLFRYKI